MPYLPIAAGKLKRASKSEHFDAESNPIDALIAKNCEVHVKTPPGTILNVAAGISNRVDELLKDIPDAEENLQRLLHPSSQDGESSPEGGEGTDGAAAGGEGTDGAAATQDEASHPGSDQDASVPSYDGPPAQVGDVDGSGEGTAAATQDEAARSSGDEEETTY